MTRQNLDPKFARRFVACITLVGCMFVPAALGHLVHAQWWLATGDLLGIAMSAASIVFVEREIREMDMLAGEIAQLPASRRCGLRQYLSPNAPQAR